MATMTMTQTSLEQRVLQSAQKRSSLRQTLQETDYATKQLPLKDGEIDNIRSQIAKIDQELNYLHSSAQQEQQKLAHIHNSHAHRAFHKKSTLQAEEADERRRLQKVEEKEGDEESHKTRLTRNLQNLQNERSAIEDDVARHDQALRGLEQMYESIFAGSSADLPEAETKREAVRDAQMQAQRAQMQLTTESNATDALNASAQFLNAAMQQLQSSNTMATVDIFAGGDLVDLMERQRLAQAQSDLNQCIVSLNQARSLQPAIPPLSDVFIDQGHILSNVLFNCAITDFMQAQRIQNTVQQCGIAVSQLQGSVAQQQMRLQNAQSNNASRGRQLADAQNDLWNCRNAYIDEVLKTKGA